MNAPVRRPAAMAAVRQAAEAGDHGVMLRLARTAAGLTLEQIGAALGCSASTLSRLENGLRPVRSITELHRIADAYDVPTEWLGLATPLSQAHRSSLTAKPDTGGETVHRRGFIAGTAGLTIVAAAGATVAMPAAHAAADTIEDVLFGRVTAEPLPAQQLAAQLAAAGADYRATRYRRLARRLPRLLAQASASHAAADDRDRGVAGGHLGQAYSLATLLLLKLHDGLAATTADRAVQAATASGNLLAAAESQRLVTTVLRRTQHQDAAQRVVLDAAERLRAGTGLRTAEEARAYGRLLAAAAYTAAIRDDRDTAWTLLTEAAARTSIDGFPPIDVAVYRISIANKLGDYGAAVDHARKVNPRAIVAPERRARYWKDTAIALHGRGRPDAVLTVLRAAERDVPEEVRYRPWAQQLTRDLLASRSGNRLSDLREFATRIGVS